MNNNIQEKVVLGRAIARLLRPRGVEAIAAEVDAAVFLLGDMPLIAPRHLGPLLAAFAPAEGRSICIPTYRTKRGNPVLWSAQYFPRLLELRGDQGARTLFRDLTDQIFEWKCRTTPSWWISTRKAALDAVLTRFA